MSVPEVPWIVRFLTGRGLRVPEQLPTGGDFPGGWPAWFAFMGYEVGVDFLPLGDPAPEGNRLNIVWARVGEDVATIDLSHVHSDGSDTVPFTDANRDTIEAAAVTLWAALDEFYDPDITVDRHIFHDFGVGIRAPNPARRTSALLDAPGTTTTEPLPPQNAISVTFKTARRRSWGRVYLPAPILSVMDIDGYVTHAFVDAVRTAFGNYADTCKTANLPLVTWAPRHDGNLLKYTSVKPKPDGYVLDVPDTSSVARSVDSIQVDDVVDVIRSRRHAKPSYVATHSL